MTRKTEVEKRSLDGASPGHAGSTLAAGADPHMPRTASRGPAKELDTHAGNAESERTTAHEIDVRRGDGADEDN
jgi:hypothetical protein